MPISREDNDKIQQDLEEQIAEKTGQAPAKPDKGEEGATGEEAEEVKPYWAQAGFKDESAFVESFKHAQATISRQGEELGQLRKAKETQDKPKPEPDKPKYTEYDPYDEDNVRWHQEKWAREERERIAKEEAEARQTQAAEQARMKMIGEFIKNHEDMSEDEMKSVATFASQRGITNLEDALTVMNATKTPQESQKAPDVDPRKVAALPKTLRNSGTGNDKEVTARDMSNQEWGDLPREERMKRLRAVS